MFRFAFYPVADSYLLVVAVAAILLALLAVGPSRNKTTSRRRLALVLLRVAVLLLVALAMLRPTVVYTETKKQQATLVVLADQTRSMTVPDAAGGKTRYEVLQKALTDSASALAKLAKEFELKAYAFDSENWAVQVSGGKIHMPEKPEGGQTAIGSVLEDVLRLEAGKRLLGVILLSDGAQRAYAPRDALPQVPASRMKQLGVALHTVPIGQSRGLGQARDVAVPELLVNETVFVKNELAVAGRVRVDGYTQRKIPVRLLFETSPGKMQPVDETRIEAASDGQLCPVRLKYVPQVPGEFKLTLEAEVQPGELVTTNNMLSTFVTVLKGGLKVLYIEGDPRVEQKFLRRSLDAAQEIGVDYLRLDARHPELRPPNLAESFEPGKYDVYILGDIDATAFTPELLKALGEAVNRGSGLVMLGGLHNFGPGGYAESPLAGVLPVVLSRFERQLLDNPIRDDLHVPGPLKMAPTDRASRHFLLQLADNPQSSLEAWRQLPPLDGANVFKEVRPGAVTLAAAGNVPLLVTQTYGSGRVLAFAGDTTWHWWMHGFENVHKRFWRQVVLWLARKDETSEGLVWVKLEQRRLPPAQRLKFLVGVRTATGQAETDFTAEAEVIGPDGKSRSVPLVRQENTASGSFADTRQPGDYAVQVIARKGDQELGKARARFLVFAQDLELDNPAADTPLMESLANMTGGQTLVPEQLPELIRRMTENTQHLEIRQETKKTLWDGWWFFLVFVSALGIEWFLRKRWGLV